MSKNEAPLGSLADFLPPGSFPLVEPFLLQYKVHLTITRSRQSVLGIIEMHMQIKHTGLPSTGTSIHMRF